MAAELPDVDLNVSYVVDNGVAVGPIALSEIARSISDGERKPNAYIWWTGRGDWVPFNSDARLTALLAIEDGDIDGEDAEEELIPVEIELAPEASMAHVEEELSLAQEEPTVLAQEEPAQLGELDDAADEVIDLDAPFSFRAGNVSGDVIDVRTPPIDESIGIGIASSLAEVDDEVFDSITITQNSVLTDVSARLDALASTTRHLQESTKLDRAGASPIVRPARGEHPAHGNHPASGDAEIDLRSHDDEDDLGSDEKPPVVIDFPDEPSEVRASTLETRFDAMVRQTVQHERLLEQSERVRELLARACGAEISRQGFSVERRNELHGHYYLSFESGADTRRIRLEISPTWSVSGDSEQNIHLVVAWGRMAFDIDEALKVVQDQLPTSDRRPGTISSDAELDTGSVSTRVELVWAIDDYVGEDYSIDRDKLVGALDAALHCLEQRWYELFIPAE